MDLSGIMPETRFEGPYGTYRFRDYAGAGPTRCQMPLALKADRLRSFTRYQCCTGKTVPHSVTGEPLDVSWVETVSHDDFMHRQVRCRVCPNCVALNSWVWARAACSFHDEVMDEGGSSAAVTLTFSELTFRRWWEEDRERRALEFEVEGKLPEAEELRRAPAPVRYFSNNREHILIARAGLGRELTLYNKRLRIHAARKPGILPVIKAWMGALEFGTKRGRPHLHLIYHLEGDDRRCRLFRRHAARDWSTRVGFTKVKRVCTYAGCSYASKYIGKPYDAGYRAFFERLRGNGKGSFGTPILTAEQSVEYARLLAVIKCQRSRTRSSLCYRSRGIPAPEDANRRLDGNEVSLFSPREKLPSKTDHPEGHLPLAPQRSEDACRECGSLDGCDCARSSRPCTDHLDEHLAQFWATDLFPNLSEDEDDGSVHYTSGEMPDPPD